MDSFNEKVGALLEEMRSALQGHGGDLELVAIEGKTVEEALAHPADAVTGATYSSESLIRNIEAGLKSVSSVSRMLERAASLTL